MIQEWGLRYKMLWGLMEGVRKLSVNATFSSTQRIGLTLWCQSISCANTFHSFYYNNLGRKFSQYFRLQPHLLNLKNWYSGNISFPSCLKKFFFMEYAWIKRTSLIMEKYYFLPRNKTQNVYQEASIKVYIFSEGNRKQFFISQISKNFSRKSYWVLIFFNKFYIRSG